MRQTAPSSLPTPLHWLTATTTTIITDIRHQTCQQSQKIHSTTLLLCSNTIVATKPHTHTRAQLLPPTRCGWRLFQFQLDMYDNILTKVAVIAGSRHKELTHQPTALLAEMATEVLPNECAVLTTPRDSSAYCWSTTALSGTSTPRCWWLQQVCYILLLLRNELTTE
ncbi:unnamed protein product [Ceratitis capitata]|uniref:(Mediterranean fruit fly) hypothetical protein n=1 Tax=Ceratitis capitata TaxID=7213 RepID=A0A811VJ52_CERCA|nr:unnamed protein product [Ceratitis capitata]